MRIRDLEPRPAITVSHGETLRGSAKLLADDEIGALVVYGPGGLVGIFSERDLTRAIADGADLDEEPVEEYMTQAPVTIDRDGALGDAIAKMNDFGFRHLIVTEEDDVIGVISMRDIVELLGTAWPEL